ncbi:hypothetical protein BBBOND_0108780 [Babesia bigemina]|uniref:Uncharacterized protein n=1 Tax=Babesia bigemina TaxID=5866 RepID=A0A061DA07_BABBI|nr:hypothetical protein BBBOND_0108780 [Babesia bigemina]CDR94580.1 hypothetical protein BBBOND_0108780 [Babesia bigemina]|eukprot:XP_012766766.1 hypothetical protein BBBOND_0108780 [Babesia bigemina]
MDYIFFAGATWLSLFALLRTAKVAEAGSNYTYPTRKSEAFVQQPGPVRLLPEDVARIHAIMDELQAYAKDIKYDQGIIIEALQYIIAGVRECVNSSGQTHDSIFLAIDSYLNLILMPPIRDRYPKFLPMDAYVNILRRRAEMRIRSLRTRIYDIWLDYVLRRTGAATQLTDRIA